MLQSTNTWGRPSEETGTKTAGMRITCPSCQSTYQLADGALGATGRKVRCTRCGTVWHALPTGDDLFEPEPPAIEAAAARFREPTEDEWKAALTDDKAGDAAGAAAAAEAAGGNVVPFRPRDEDGEPGEAASDAAAAPEPTVEADPPGFEPEKRTRKTESPARKPLRRSNRRQRPAVASMVVGGAAAFALFVIVGAFTGRETVVRLFPDFASLYELVGLKVNLRGLDFSEVETHREMDGSTPILVVEGRIDNVSAGERPVPSLRFALLSASDREVYAWTMEPPKPRLEPGETIRFKSRLPAPPDAAVDAEVRFTDRRGP